MNAKINDLNTSLYDGSSVIVTEPSTGEILAFASKMIINDNGNYRLFDNSPSMLTNPVTPGSIVKGASISVGYKYGVIDIGTTMLDECIKIQNTPEKCSWISGIGLINDVEALAISSNSYQYKTAIRLSGSNYYYNGPLEVPKESFDKYRNMFNEYGLGVKTGIDLPIESLGVIGNRYDSGLLLDFSIGQYDTYTPVQISSYISTIASSGNRYKLHFLKEIRNSSKTDKIGDLKKKIEPELIHKVNLDSKYIDSFLEVVVLPEDDGPASKTILILSLLLLISLAISSNLLLCSVSSIFIKSLILPLDTTLFKSAELVTFINLAHSLYSV